MVGIEWLADGPQIAIASGNIGRFNFGSLVRDHHGNNNNNYYWWIIIWQLHQKFNLISGCMVVITNFGILVYVQVLEDHKRKM